MNHKYEVLVYWSEEDGCFIAEVPELRGCVAHGDTHIAAVGEVETVVNAWLELAKAESWNIPVPKGKLMYA